MEDREREHERYRRKLIGRQTRTAQRRGKTITENRHRSSNVLTKVIKTVAACISVIIAAALAATFIRGDSTNIPNGEAYFYFFDVGQADAAAIITKDSCILIDAGSNLSAAHFTEKLRKIGVNKIDLAVFSHAHEDHIGGGDSVLKEFEVAEILMPSTDIYSSTLDRLLTVADKRDIPIIDTESVKTLTVGELTVDVLPALPNADDENEASVIIKVSFGNTAAIYTGDAGTDSERYLLSQFDINTLDCDILKVGHHGSDTSTCDEWIAALSPDFAVISCQFGNEYGHPNHTVLRRLQNAGAEICRTDKDGSVLLVSNGTGVTKRECNGGKYSYVQ